MSWQEAYDLGEKYLSEGSYKEAVLAFSAAIHLDPKAPAGYVGRGDAYAGLAEADSGQAQTYLEHAASDYEQAIALDGGDAEVYLKLADVYTSQGRTQDAAALRQQGYEATGDERLSGESGGTQDGGQQAGDTSDTAGDVPSDMSDGKGESEVLNNGGYMVGSGETVYLRRYKLEDVEQTCVFSTFRPGFSGMDGFTEVPSEKQMIAYNTKTGAIRELFADGGSGPIVLLDGQFYLQQENGETGTVYRVNMDGKDRRDLLQGSIICFDEASRRLVCRSGGDLVCLSPDGEAVTVATGVFEYDDNYAGTIGGRIFYSVPDSNSGRACNGALTLMSVSTEGKDLRTLIKMDADLYGSGEREGMSDAQIVCLQQLGDWLYFNYGSYGGSGNFFQGGRLMRVKTDGSDAEQLADTTSEDFYVCTKDGADHVTYCNNDWLCLNTATGDTAPGTEAAPLGRAYIDPDTLRATQYPDAGGDAQTLFSKEDLPSVQKIVLGEETLTSVDEVNVVGNHVFYRVIRGTHTPDKDIGWRMAYTLDSAEIFCRDITSGKVNQIYKY